MIQQKQLSEKEMLRFVSQDFFQSLIQSKQMIVSSATDTIDTAISSVIDGVKYAVENWKSQEKVRLHIWMYKQEHAEPEFRQVEMTYKEILEDIIQHGGGSPLDVAERMFQCLQNIKQEDWDKLMKELEGKPEKPLIL